jgi:hypothetical protein
MVLTIPESAIVRDREVYDKLRFIGYHSARKFAVRMKCAAKEALVKLFVLPISLNSVRGGSER